MILSLQGLAAFQLVSVESQGRAVVWTVLDTQRDFNTQLGLAHWGQVNGYECACDEADDFIRETLIRDDQHLDDDIRCGWSPLL